MIKSHKLIIALLILFMSAITIPAFGATHEMCDKCKENPEDCKMLKGEDHDCQDCIADAYKTDKKVIEKKVIVRMPEDKRGFLGVYTTETEKGILIESVIPESPAEKAGIFKGMTLVSINGVKVKTRQELIDVLVKTKPNDEATVVVKSDKDEKTLKVILAEAPKTETKHMKIEAKTEDCQDQDMKNCPRHMQKMEMDMPDIPMQKMPGFIGVVTEEKDGKLVIKSVVPESPAELEGLKPKDQIVEINGVTINTPDQLRNALKTSKPGDIVDLKVISNGQQKMMRIKLAPSPTQPRFMPEMWQDQTPKRKTKMKMMRRPLKHSRGAGYFGPGITMFKYDQLNTMFVNHGLDTIDKNQFTFGGGGWGQTGRVRLGGYGMGGGQTLVNDSVSVEVGYGVGFFEVGYSLINAKHFIFTPMLGIGGGGLGMKIIARYPPASLDSLLSYPGGKSQITMGGLSMYPGLTIDIPISFIGLSLKGGYIWSPISSGWIHEGFGAISGPDINLNGPFASLGIMFGGGK